MFFQKGMARKRKSRDMAKLGKAMALRVVWSVTCEEYLYPCFCCVGEMWRRGVVFTLLKIYLFCSFVWVNGSIFGAGIVLQF
jgi:hypothetical protein